MRLLYVVLILCAAAALCSCSSADQGTPIASSDVAQDPVVGLWKAKSEGTVQDVPPGPNVAQIKQRMLHPTLNVKADHTFEYNDGYPITGTWKEEGNVYNLTATSIAGTSAQPGGTSGGMTADSPPMNAALSEDKNTLTLTGDPGHPFNANAVTMDFGK